MIQVKLSPDEFAAKAAQLKSEQGIEIRGASGSIEKSGVKANYQYENDTLSVVIVSKPFLVTKEYCEKQLLAWLAGS